MSKLESEDFIFCSYCNVRMQEILLCKTRSQKYDLNNNKMIVRCQIIVCEHCESCVSCRERYQELKNGLIRNRYDRNDQQERCQWYIDHLKSEFNEDY